LLEIRMLVPSANNVRILLPQVGLRRPGWLRREQAGRPGGEAPTAPSRNSQQPAINSRKPTAEQPNSQG
jgi:hypothetical protein